MLEFKSITIMDTIFEASMSKINPKIQIRKRAKKPLSYYCEGLLSGDRYILGECITIIESQQEKDRMLRQQLLSYAAKQPSATRRIAITGSPGAGKSTMVEALGVDLVHRGAKVAVLAIDPSSSQSSGSILGDKTRMENLTQLADVYVRPTPAGKTLGGTARTTRETMTLCEAAGFDTIVIETVGVGQSETEVAGLVDIMLLLLLPGAGDDVQGIKRGIMELADLLIVNKSDGDRLQMARDSVKSYRSAVSLLPTQHDGWQPRVLTASALEHRGIDTIMAGVDDFYTSLGSDYITHRRQRQDADWYQYQMERRIIDRILQVPKHATLVGQYYQAILSQDQDPFGAVEATLQEIFEQ